MGLESFLKTGKVWISNNLMYWRSRADMIFRKFYKQQHQLTSVTASNRYPELFAAAQMNAATHGKILSFGCSTGEECFSLQGYFPDSAIVGVDINARNIKTAIRRNTSPTIKFLYSSPEIISAEGKYDLIFCLSVLCRWEDTKFVDNCEEIYPFSKYEETVEMLAQELTVGGLMVIYNSNFRFEDTKIFASGFEIVPTPQISDSGFVYKFDINNNRLTESHKYCIYRRKSR